MWGRILPRVWRVYGRVVWGLGGFGGLFGVEGFDGFLPGNYPWAGGTIFVAELMFCVVTKYFS